MSRIVFKVGSSVLAKENSIAKERMLNLVSLLTKVRKMHEVILVTSGAVAAGYTALKLDRNKQISKKVLAAVGQPILMSSYKSMFDIYDVNTAQILLTENDFDSRSHTKIFQQIVNHTLDSGILPILNENDISTTPDQLFGDNDQLSAHVAYHTDADMLVILSDIEGYYDSNPKENTNAKILKVVSKISEEELSADTSANHEFATGGIVTKLKAADFLLKHDKEMFLCSGYNLKAAHKFLLEKIHDSGTLFSKKENK